MAETLRSRAALPTGEEAGSWGLPASDSVCHVCTRMCVGTSVCCAPNFHNPNNTQLASHAGNGEEAGVASRRPDVRTHRHSRAGAQPLT